MTTPAGGYAPGANDLPGMSVGTDVSGTHRNVGFLDAGTCSKTVRALPAMANFFRNVRNALGGLQNQTQANTGAVQNLMQTQADFNNETNLLNYWMRQVSPQMDKVNIELVTSNDALAGMQTSNPTSSDQPGVPDGLTLLPSPEIDGGGGYSLMMYFVRPSYSGSSAITGYEMVTFPSEADGLSWSNSSVPQSYEETDLATLTNSSPWNVANCDDMFSVYGRDLRVIPTGIPSDCCVRVRARNTSGVGSAVLWGPWSAATMVCKAAQGPADLTPQLDSVIPGCALSLVSWRVPMVRQSDFSYAPVGGIHSYFINEPANVVAGGSSCVAQIPLVQTALIAPLDAMSVFVRACRGADGSLPIGTASNSLIITVPLVMPPPRIDVRIVTETTGSYALINCGVYDYYTDTVVKYTAVAHDLTSGIQTLLNIANSSDPAALDPVHRCQVRLPAIGYLSPSHNYSFSATAQHVAMVYESVSCANVGPFLISSVHGPGPVFTLQPVNMSASVGNSVTLSAMAPDVTLSNTTDYQWFSSTLGDVFTAMGVLTDSVTVVVAPAGMLYRVDATNNDGTTSSNIVRVIQI